MNSFSFDYYSGLDLKMLIGSTITRIKFERVTIKENNTFCPYNRFLLLANHKSQDKMRVFLFELALAESWEREYAKLQSEDVTSKKKDYFGQYKSDYLCDMNDRIKSIQIYGEEGRFSEINPRSGESTEISYKSFDSICIEFESSHWLYITHIVRGMFQFSKRVRISPLEYLNPIDHSLKLLKSF